MADALGQAVLGGFFAGVLLKFFVVSLARFARDTRHRRGGV